jgi:hypothetical protein
MCFLNGGFRGSGGLLPGTLPPLVAPLSVRTWNLALSAWCVASQRIFYTCYTTAPKLWLACTALRHFHRTSVDLIVSGVTGRHFLACLMTAHLLLTQGLLGCTPLLYFYALHSINARVLQTFRHSAGNYRSLPTTNRPQTTCACGSWRFAPDLAVCFSYLRVDFTLAGRRRLLYHCWGPNLMPAIFSPRLFAAH